MSILFQKSSLLTLLVCGFAFSLQAEEKFDKTYLNPDWIAKHEWSGNVFQLVKMYKGHSDKNVQEVGVALDLSRHILRKNSYMLREQLQARLINSSNPALKKFQNLPRKYIQLRSEWDSFDQAGGPLLRTVHVSRYQIYSMAVSPDGKYFVIGADNRIRVWNIATGRRISEMQGVSEFVHSLAITPDGERIVAGYRDGFVRVWDRASGKLLKTIQVVSKENGNDSIKKIVLMADGTQVMVALPGEGIHLWDMTTGKKIRTMNKTKNIWNNEPCLAISPDEKHAVSSAYSQLRAWNIATAQENQVFYRDHRKIKVSRSSIKEIAFTPDGKNIVSAAKDKTVKVWEFPSRKLLRTFKGFYGDVNKLVITPDGKKMITGSEGGILKLWNLVTGELIWVTQGHQSHVCCLKVTPDGKQLISAGGRTVVKIWDISKMTTKYSSLEKHSRMNGLAVSADGKTILSSSDYGGLLKWDTGKSQPIFLPNSKISSEFNISPKNLYLKNKRKRNRFVLLTPDGKQWLSNFSKEIHLLDIANNKKLRIFKGHKEYIRAAVLTLDGKQMISGADNELILWDVATGKMIKKFKHHVGPIQTLAITPDATRIIIGSKNKIKIRDIATGKMIRVLRGHTNNVTCLAVTLDNKNILSGSYDNILRVTDIESGLTLEKLTGHTDSISALIISPDGKWAISGSSDKTVRVWNIDHNNNYHLWVGLFSYRFDNAITALAMSRDGKKLIVSDDFTRVHKLKILRPQK